MTLVLLVLALVLAFLAGVGLPSSGEAPRWRWNLAALSLAAYFASLLVGHL